MKRIAIGFLLICSLLDAGLQEQRIQEIKFEMAKLEKQKQELQREASANYRQEMQYEMQSQREIVEYEWHDVGESLKNAEASEQMAHSKEAEVRKIDQRLIQLANEKDLLIQQDKSSK